MATHLHERIPELASLSDEHALLGDTEASCTANLTQIVEMLSAGALARAARRPRAGAHLRPGPRAPADPARGPAARVPARAMRTSGSIASGELRREIRDETALVASVEAASNFMFEYIDGVSDQLVAAYHVERDRWVRSAAAIRAETVRQIIDGEIEHERARQLPPRLRAAPPPRRADPVRRSGPPARRRGAGARGGRGRGGPRLRRPLLVTAGAAVLWAWCGTFKPPAPEALARVEAHRPHAGIRMAVGRPGYGIEGFRVSHIEAGHAARFWSLDGAFTGGGTTSYRTVEVVSLLASDLDRARRFVLSELGPLAEQSDSAAAMRSTLLGFLAHGGSHVRAAQELHMHQNTVYNRVRRAEELIGAPVSARRVELQTALMLAETLGSEVLH